MGWIPAFAGMTRTRSVELAKKLGEVAVAGLVRGSLERAAQGRRDAGMSRRQIDPDDSPVHWKFRSRNHLTL